MLPFEAHLLAAGWPRYVDAEPSGEEGEDGSSGGGGGSSGERVVTKEGSRGARMLFQARRSAARGAVWCLRACKHGGFRLLLQVLACRARLVPAVHVVRPPCLLSLPLLPPVAGRNAC